MLSRGVNGKDEVPAKPAIATVRINEPHAIRPGVEYVAKKYHHNGIKNGRNTNRKKSQWTITPTAEARCFANAYDSGWINAGTAWGVRIRVGQPRVLGLSVENVSLFIAKFRHSAPYWSGYPSELPHADRRPPAHYNTRRLATKRHHSEARDPAY